MISQQVFLGRTELNSGFPDALIRAVLRGPREWLKPVVLEVLPSSVVSNGTWIDDEGIAHLSLSSEVEALSADRRLQLAVQFLYTLSYFGQVRGLQIRVDGSPLSVSGADDSGVLRFDAVSEYSPKKTPENSDLFAIQNSAFVRLPNGEGEPVDLPGPLGTPSDQRFTDLAVSETGNELALLNDGRTTLYRASTGSGELKEVYSGQSLSRGQFDDEGRLWTLDSTSSGVQAVVASDSGDPLIIPIPALGSDTVTGFRIAPDSTRMAIISSDGVNQHVGFLLIGHSAEQIVIDGWRELMLNISSSRLVGFRQLSFLSDERLMLVGAEKDSRYRVYSVDVDASQVISQVPLGSGDVMAIATLPLSKATAAFLMTPDGEALHFEAQYRWEEQLTGVTDIAFPS